MTKEFPPQSLPESEKQMDEPRQFLSPIGEMKTVEQIENENSDTIAIIQHDDTGQLWVNRPYSGDIQPVEDYATAINEIWESEKWYQQGVDEDTIQFLIDQGQEINPHGDLYHTYLDMERDGKLK